MALQFAFAIHRGLGCDDESATDEEQAEKILFYHPRLTTLSDQLNTINMIEGLIDFAGKFSIDPISTVVMQQYTWAFYECEKDVWFIIATDSQIHPQDHTTDSSIVASNHQPNTHAMKASLEAMYAIYCCINGSITGALAESTGLISTVKSLRKQVRKIRLRQRQEQQDLQSIIDHESAVQEGDGASEAEPVERLGIRSNTKTKEQAEAEVAASQAEIDTLQAKLAIALDDPTYTPVRVRAALERFILWYLHAGQLDIHTALEGMAGMRPLLPCYPDPVLHTLSTYGNLGAGGNGSAGSAVGAGAGAAVAAGLSALAGTTSGALQNSPAGSIHSGVLATSGSAFSSTVLRVRHAVEAATSHKSIGCLVLYDGRVAWSDLDTVTTRALAEFVNLQEAQVVRAPALLAVQSLDTRPLPATSSSSGGTGSGGGSARESVKKNSTPEAELEAAVQRVFAKLLTQRGFITRGWEVLNLEESRICPLLLPPAESSPTQRTGTEGFSSSSTSAGNVSAKDAKDGSVRIASGDHTGDVTSAHCEGASKIYCPRIYAQDGGAAEAIGRAVFHKQGRAMIMVLLPDWDSSQNSHVAHASQAAAEAAVAGATEGIAYCSLTEASRPVSTVGHRRLPSGSGGTSTSNSSAAKANLVGSTGTGGDGLDYRSAAVALFISQVRSNPRKLANLRCPEFLDFLARHDPTAPRSAEHKSEPSLSSMGSSRTGESGVMEGANTAPDAAGPLDLQQESRILNHACLVALCAQLQRDVTPECARLDKVLKGAVYADETGALLKHGHIPGTTDHHGGSGGGSSGGGASGAVSASPGGVSSGGSATPGASAGAAYERLAAAMTIAEELQLGSVSQELPVPPSLRNVRFIYFNPIDGSLKTCGLNSNDLSPLLCSPRAFRELLVSNLLLGGKTMSSSSSSSFATLAQGLSSRSSLMSTASGGSSGGGSGGIGPAGSASRLRRVTAAVIDRLTDKQGFKFPTSSALLAECLEPPVVRALNDIWIQLSAQDQEAADTHPLAVQEACLRVSTPQRGGVWVIGRRIGERFLYMIIDKCVTMNDVYFAFDHLAEFLQK